ncbi:MAG: hypothetical protein ABL857_05820 [Rickettsiales bacterium]
MDNRNGLFAPQSKANTDASELPKKLQYLLERDILPVIVAQELLKMLIMDEDNIKRYAQMCTEQQLQAVIQTLRKKNKVLGRVNSTRYLSATNHSLSAVQNNKNDYTEADLTQTIKTTLDQDQEYTNDNKQSAQHTLLLTILVPIQEERTKKHRACCLIV